MCAAVLSLAALVDADALPPRPGSRYGSRPCPSVPASVLRPAPGTKSGLPGNFRVVVIPAAFSDLGFTFDAAHIDDLFNKTAYAFSGARGSVKDYLKDQFGESVAFSFDIASPVTLSQGYATYGSDDAQGRDTNPGGLLREACGLSDAEVDFSVYDAVYIIYAGGNQADGGADADHLWPRAAVLESTEAITLDGASIRPYAMSSELMLCSDGSMTLSSIGPICHEMSHLMGLPDLYDTDYDGSGGRDAGLRTLSLMADGCYNNDGRTPPVLCSAELDYLGLESAETLMQGELTLPPLSSGRRFLRLSGSVPDEYYLFEARSREGWDMYIGCSGLAVYHIDRSGHPAGYSTRYDRVLTASERWQYNEVNARPDYPCCDLVEAVPEAAGTAGLLFPEEGRDALSEFTSPALAFRWGGSHGYSLSGITQTSEGVIFTVNGPVKVSSMDIFQDAAIFTWTAEGAMAGSPCRVLVHRSGAETLIQTLLEPSEDGFYHFTAEGLLPLTDYTLELVYGSGEGALSTNCPFSTKAVAGKTFIYMSEGGRIPLRVYNAADVDYVQWTLDGKAVKTGYDGYFTLPPAGELRAHVHYKDGREEILVKRLGL